jgi:hypothetical protein
MRDVMLDLETMGNGPDAAITAIGAVCFNPVGGTVGPGFYRVVDLASSVAAAGVKDLAEVCTRGGLPSEFSMRVPAELDRDADLVISEAARRLTAVDVDNERLRNSLRWLVELEAEKEENGESALYLEERDRAWVEARALVG